MEFTIRTRYDKGDVLFFRTDAKTATRVKITKVVVVFAELAEGTERQVSSLCVNYRCIDEQGTIMMLHEHQLSRR